MSGDRAQGTINVIAVVVVVRVMIVAVVADAIREEVKHMVGGGGTNRDLDICADARSRSGIGEGPILKDGILADR